MLENAFVQHHVVVVVVAFALSCLENLHLSLVSKIHIR